MFTNNPNLVRLWSVDWAIAHEVFVPAAPWLIKDENAFMVKQLQLVLDQRKELETDLTEEDF